MRKAILLAGMAMLSSTVAVPASAQQAPAPAPAAAVPPAAPVLDRPPADALYRRAGAPIADRVRDLLGRMTLDEKVAQLQSSLELPLVRDSAAGLTRGGVINEQIARRVMPNGIGTFSLLALEGRRVDETNGRANLIQHWVMEHSRLGIPIMFHGEALHGAVVDGVTSFPQANALGQTWDPALLRQVFGVTARQSRAAGFGIVLAPVLDIARDPRYGRVEEMYSEDPYLTGELGLAAVQGLQGTGPTVDRFHVLATAKHFVHGQPENGTNTAPSDFSERTLRQTFLVPFERAVRDGHIGALMTAYTALDGGVPSTANRHLLRDILRNEWHFDGLTVSDYTAVTDLLNRHHIAANIADAGVQALNAGLDIEMPSAAGFHDLADAVRVGRVSQATLDEAVSRVLTAKFRLGLFERPYADLALARPNDPQDNALARRAADEAIVLLRNEGNLLPLSATATRNLAVIGPNADHIRLGGYSGIPQHSVTVLQGIRERLGRRANVTYAEGVRITEQDSDPIMNKIAPFTAPDPARDAQLIAQAVETARAADTVVLVLGSNETVVGEAFGPEFSGRPAYRDVDTLELPGRQMELARQVLALGKPTVVVLLNGRSYAIEELSRTAPAILQGGYLGQETGGAVAGALFGDTNPGGRLSATIARNVGQLPVFYYRMPQSRMGYVGSDNSPLYPFGFGLSYTTFRYGTPQLDRTQIGRDGTARVSVAVTNTGQRAGDEVVQMYVHPQTSSVAQPLQRLAGFQRVSLAAGQTTTVSFPVGPEQLAIWDRDMHRTVEAGTVDVAVGRNVADLQTVQLQVGQ